MENYQGQEEKCCGERKLSEKRVLREPRYSKHRKRKSKPTAVWKPVFPRPVNDWVDADM